MSRLLKNLYSDVFEKPLRALGYLRWNLDYGSSKGARQAGGRSKQWRYVNPGAMDLAEEFETLAQEVAHAA